MRVLKEGEIKVLPNGGVLVRGFEVIADDDDKDGATALSSVVMSRLKLALTLLEGK